MTKARGPVPKRTDERRRRNKDPGQSKAQAAGAVRPPATPRGRHPVARRWYASLKDSGQSQFYEPSDWAAAEYVAEVMTKNLTEAGFSAAGFAAVWSAMDSLLTTEASRRRVRLEIERQREEPADDRVSSFERYANHAKDRAHG